MDDRTLTDQLNDDDDAIAALIGAPRSSVAKLEEGLAQLADAKSDDAGSQFALSSLVALLPTLRRLGFIPNDPAELDQLLLIGARWALGLRSDDAWQPQTLDELFLGPESPASAPQGGDDAAA
jgi:hypothetical protein